MKVVETQLPGVLIVEPDRFGDTRGFFQEIWHEGHYQEAGISGPFVQDNLSLSGHGVLRGLHFQNPNPQGKLVYVLQGEAFDVAVDIRAGSATFGNWTGVTLSGDNGRQFFVPPGYAHGFCVTGETALFAYKCTDFYNPRAEGAIRWDDPAIGIDWPVSDPAVSARDIDAPLLADIDPARLPRLEGGK